MKTALFSLVFVLALSFNFARAAYLEQDYEEKGEEVRSHDHVMPRRVSNDVTDFMDKISIGRPYTERNLTVYPLSLSRDEDDSGYVTLDKALDRGYLEIVEKGQGNVSSITVRNNSGSYVFLMAGEILGGGKQNRTISKDVLLGPRGDFVEVPVYCVEQHRWAVGGKRGFYSVDSVATNSMRAMTQSGEGQDKVWGEVSRLSSGNSVKSSTSNLQDVYDDREVKERLAVYDPLLRLPRDTVGVVVVCGDRILGADIFCNEGLFDDLWPKVLRSYSLEGISFPVPVRNREIRPRDESVSTDDVRRYLGNVYSARFLEERGIDLGDLINISGSVDGKALTYRRAVIHLNLSPVRWRRVYIEDRR